MADPVANAASRRCFLLRSAGFAAGAGILPAIPFASVRAAPQAMQAAIRKIIGEGTLQQGRVKLDPLTVAVESPMTATDHVKAIHIVNEKNPQPQVISVTIGPRAGRATLSTRIKLADSQQIVAVAEMSDGSFWSGSAEVIVTIAACVEDLVR